MRRYSFYLTLFFMLLFFNIELKSQIDNKGQNIQKESTSRTDFFQLSNMSEFSNFIDYKNDSLDNYSGNFPSHNLFEKTTRALLYGLLFSIPGGGIGFALGEKSPFASKSTLWGLAVGYGVGCSIGLKLYDDNLSLPGLLISGGLGGFLGMQLFINSDQKGFISFMPILLPTLFTITYSELFKPEYSSNLSFSYFPSFSQKQLQHSVFICYNF